MKISVVLADEVVVLLDALAEKRKLSRAAMIEALIRELREGGPMVEAPAPAARGSRRGRGADEPKSKRAYDPMAKLMRRAGK